MAGLLRECWAIARPYWKSKERWGARGLLALVVGLNLGQVYINVLLNKWNNDFYNSLQEANKEAFYAALFRFTYLAFAFIVVVVYKQYFNQMLRINWRRWMTAHYLSDWLGRQNYYRLQLFGKKTDNPDQRISEDIEQFIQLTLGLGLDLMSSVVTLFSFLAILWGLSGTLDFMLGATHVAIPGYMVWVALVYAIIGTWLTFKVGRPLVKLNYDQQRFEADFRFSLVRLRENSESVAFYKGEGQEQANFMLRFSSVVDNFWSIMLRQKKLNWLNSFYGQIAIIFPYVVAAPRFFAKEIQLGGLMQTASAFGRVQESLSFIVDAYVSIANWRAVIERLSGFNQSMRNAEASAVPQAGYTRQAAGQVIEAKDLTLKLPDGSVLLKNLNLTVMPGDTMLITGPSGVGKSTLLRALAGLWPYVEGTLTLPDATMMFVPQKPYLPLGTLESALYYPQAPAAERHALNEALSLCQLDHLLDKLDVVDNWSHMLSLGEQQRIAFARVLLAAPQFLFLDEASSALDEVAEAHLYDLLKKRLPQMAIVSVGHRSTLKAFHAQEKKL